MSIALFAGMMYNTALRYNSQMKAMNANQSLMAMTNSVTGNESMAQINQLAQAEKAIMFGKLQAEFNNEYAMAAEEYYAKALKKDMEQQRRLNLSA
jgi:hypothetical protein